LVQVHDLALREVEEEDYEEAMDVDHSEVIVENALLSVMVEGPPFCNPLVQLEDPSVVQLEDLSSSLVGNSSLNKVDVPTISQDGGQPVHETDYLTLQHVEACTSRVQEDSCKTGNPSSENADLSQSDMMSQSKTPALSQSDAISQSDNPALSQLENPALSQVESPALSRLESPALSQLET